MPSSLEASPQRYTAKGMRRWSRGLVLAFGIALLMCSQIASAMPLDQGTLAARQLLEDASTINDHSDNAIDRRAEEKIQGYSNVHPLNKRQQRVISVAVTAPPVVTVTAPAIVTVARSSSQAASATSKPSSSSLPTVIPVSSSNAKATPVNGPTPATSSAAANNNSNSIFSIHNKLFPIGLAAIVGIVFGAMIVIITIIRCVMRAKMTPEEKAGEYGNNSKRRNGGIALRSAHTLRRAFTRGKLGSFARRNQEGSVLIDVGDEVYAVSPEVAREYERERNMMGTAYGNKRQALQNAQITVAANQSGSSQGSNVLYKMDNGSQHTVEEMELQRSISQRVTDGLRSVRSQASNEALDQQARDCAYSFDSEKQQSGDLRQAEVPPTAYLPVVTRGAKEWDIRPQRDHSEMGRIMQSNGSQSSLISSQLSHERHTLTDAPIRAAGGIERHQPPRYASERANQSERRPKSILIRRDEHGNPIRSSQNQGEQRGAPPRPRGARRVGTISSSTSPASPRVLQGRSGGFPSTSPPLYMRPALPSPTQSSSESGSPKSSTRSLIRSNPIAPPSYHSEGRH